MSALDVVIAADGAAADGQFLGVDWGSFVLVFVTAMAASVFVVATYAFGLRLLGTGDSAAERPPAATAVAYLCFAVGVAAVLYGIYLIIPFFHGS
jgi:hypothetical protein